jgi:hypothetical protein
MGHSAAEPIEIQTEARAWREEFSSGIVQHEVASRRFFEDALADKVSEHQAKIARVTRTRRRKCVECVVPGPEPFGDTQRRRDVHAPGRAEVG